jgi:transposase
MLEYGYKHEGPHAPQVKLSIVADKDSGIPLMYDLYPGSIIDVTTLFNTVHKIRDMGVTGYTLILDRGFFSKENLALLQDEGVRFVMPGYLKLKDVKETISREHDTITDPGCLRMYHDKVVFVKPVSITVEGLPVEAYYYYDQDREKWEKDTFYKTLYRVVEELRNHRVKSLDYQRIVLGIAGKYYKYLDVHRNIDSSLTVDVRKNAVSQRINRMGRYLICHQGEMTWEECLRTYKERDMIEKRFHHLKNDLEAVPMHVQKESTMRGFIFICFIALILRMRLQEKLEETRLDKNYSVEALLLELEKIHLIRLENGEQLLTEQTKKQKDIIKKLGLETCYQKTGN